MSEKAEQFRDYAERIADLIDKIDDLRQRVRDAMESYGTSVSNRQARIINRLTILSAIFLPLTFLTGFFGMNFQWLIESIASFRVFLILGIGLFVATLVTTLALFRGRGWLDGDRRPSRANESSTVAGRRAT
jgi:Mg2+ and Co2+ transporter CorA